VVRVGFYFIYVKPDLGAVSNALVCTNAL
jgi:hypothetical protein